MRVEWFGQSAFHLGAEQGSVAIDPFGDMSALTAGRGIQFDYPQIEGVEAELLLVTHEHVDHNGVEAIGGEPAILRSTAGKLESPRGEVTAIASEHDEAAGTERGPNTIFCFELDGRQRVRDRGAARRRGPAAGRAGGAVAGFRGWRGVRRGRVAALDDLCLVGVVGHARCQPEKGH
jgi:Beta-lactamase superfamily domain